MYRHHLHGLSGNLTPKNWLISTARNTLLLGWHSFSLIELIPLVTQHQCKLPVP